MPENQLTTGYVKFDVFNIEIRHIIMIEKEIECPNCKDKICHYCAVNKTKRDEWVCDECYSKMDIYELEE